jgi:hypothetical protein
MVFKRVSQRTGVPGPYKTFSPFIPVLPRSLLTQHREESLHSFEGSEYTTGRLNANGGVFRSGPSELSYKNSPNINSRRMMTET